MKDESECKCITNFPVHKNRFFYAKLKLSFFCNLQKNLNKTDGE